MNLVIMGAQWGDEGKGKIVDFLAAESDIVLRYSGGANAGHTVVIGEKTYKLHLIPSGITHADKRVVLGSGMVIDLESLFSELDGLSGQGINWQGRVLISGRAHLVLPRYRDLDREMDSKRKLPIGTTGRGIGVAYGLKANRDGIRVVDLFDSSIWEKLSAEDRAALEPFRERVREMVVDITYLLYKEKPLNILFEGAQGTLLDIDSGTYPYVSSGVSCASGAAIGAGIGPKDINRILGVFKAYSTRVGNGPFPSEFSRDRDGDLESTIRELGREYGVTTGRPRRCGYLDLVALKYGCLTNSIDSLVMTHLDVYDEMEEISVCTSYNFKGKEFLNFPASLEILEGAMPALRSFKGWRQDISGCNRYEDLPVEAREYLEFIEEYTDTRIDIISVGYRREETIVRKDPWTPS